EYVAYARGTKRGSLYPIASRVANRTASKPQLAKTLCCGSKLRCLEKLTKSPIIGYRPPVPRAETFQLRYALLKVLTTGETAYERDREHHRSTRSAENSHRTCTRDSAKCFRDRKHSAGEIRRQNRAGGETRNDPRRPPASCACHEETLGGETHRGSGE